MPGMTTHVQPIRISGADAMAFAHAQFSSHVDTLDIGRWQFSAWLDARGRTRAVFHLARLSTDTLLLCLRGGDATTFVAELRRFVFRAKVTIGIEPTAMISTAPAMPLHGLVHHGEDWLLGCGDHGMRVGPGATPDDRWRVAQWHAGWPWLPTILSTAYLPQALSLERLGGVVTDKGCYPGQEIMARLHFRGATSKRHLCSAWLSHMTDAGPLSHADGMEIGGVLDAFTASGRVHALLVLADAAIEANPDGRLDVHQQNLSIMPVTHWPA